MPEMTLTVRWPDGRVEECYSPSLVLHDHLATGEVLTVAEFERRVLLGLTEASDRVRARYGFACTSAEASQEQVRRSAAGYAADDEVDVVRMWPPLPAPEQARTEQARTEQSGGRA